MPDLLVELPSGQQVIIGITDTGEYYDPAKVLWDERIDGVMPAVTLGKMERSGSDLVTLAEYTTEHLAAINAAAVPKIVTMAAGRIAMERQAVLSAVDALIVAAGGEALIWWESADQIKRDFPLVETVRVGMGWTQEYVDSLFILAEQIENGG